MPEAGYRFPIEEPDDDPGEAKMGFLDHLDELRSRIIRSCIAIGLGMLIAFVFVDRIANFVLAPTLRLLPPGASLLLTKPGEGLSFYMDLALIGGVVLAAPFVTYQVWRFIAWIVGPKRRDAEPSNRTGSNHLRLVFAAAVIDQARRHRTASRDEHNRPRRTS
jgi:hypothetical protein